MAEYVVSRNPDLLAFTASNSIMITIANDRVGYIVDDAGYDSPTFAATASPLQRGYAEPAIVNGLVDMMEM